jgi:thioredoxin reductase
MTSTVPVAVIGAGPYGLSTAAHLQAASVDARVFGDPMSAWRDHMPVGMYLKSTPRASSLSSPCPDSTLSYFNGDPAKDSDSYAIPIDEFIRYGRWFQERFIPHVERERVDRIERDGDAFRIGLESGEELRARSVVAAIGHVTSAYVPPELADVVEGVPDPSAPVSHASQHRDPTALAGKEVAVVGAGQSALESAALLQEAGATVRVVVRGSRVLWGEPPDVVPPTGLRRALKPSSNLGPGWSLYSFANAPHLYRRLPDGTRLRFVGSVLGPSGAWWLRERVDGVVPVLTGVPIRKARYDGARVTLESDRGVEVEVDHVIAATGYRVDVDRLGLLADDVRRGVGRIGTAPRLDAGFESSVPGLYFTGLSAAPTFGPVLRFVAGTRFAARRVSRAIVRRTSDRT